ncbi:hypothetical protein [Vibrio comitans]
MKYVIAVLAITASSIQFAPLAEAKVNNNSEDYEIVVHCANNPNDQSTKCTKLKK